MPTVVGLLIQPAIFVRIVLIGWKAILWPDLMLLLTLRRLLLPLRLSTLRRSLTLRRPLTLRRFPTLRQHLIQGLLSSNQKIGEYNI